MSDREYVCGRFARVPDLGVSRRAAPIDPAAEKAALEWLGRKLEAASAECSDHDFFNIKAIQRLLAEPRLPAGPSDELLMTLRHAAAYPGERRDSLDSIRSVYRALYAHLTKPATKTVEVWHVEYILLPDHPAVNVYHTHADAQANAASFKDPAARCVRVTGPHKQEVPT